MAHSKLYKTILVGHLWINVPVTLIGLGLPISSLYLFENIILKIGSVIIGALVGFAISWLFWSFSITKWRLWAFNQVDEEDWYLLKEIAISNKLIWHDGSDFESTEIRTRFEQERITEIAERINEQAQIEDIKLDLGTPEVLRFNFNKTEILAESISKLLVLVVAIGAFFMGDAILGLVLLSVILFYGDSYKLLPYVFNDQEGLVISNTGIKLSYPREQSFLWEEINHVSFNIDERKMTIAKQYSDEYEELEKIVVELWRYNIKDYSKFKRQVVIIIDRLSLENT